VRIEPWGPGDLELLEQLMGDPAMTEHLGGPESPEKIRKRQDRYAAPGSGMFKIVDASTGAGVGSVGFWEREWRGGLVWEVGWSVVPAAQGRGLASAATALVLARARDAGSHRYVHAFPASDNPPSNAICRKLGFTLLEVCRFEYPPNSGNWMLCNDWRLDLSLPSPRDGEASGRDDGGST
jgi:RimJ/RimL family protein N-acetyltransferase